MTMRHILVTAVLLASVLVAHADDSPMPQLGDHAFVPVLALTEPFITTHVQTTVGLGQTVNATVPVIDLETDEVIGSAKASIMVAGIGFRYQHAVKDWLAVRVGLGVVGRLGTSTTSLVAEGITTSVGYDLGWQVRIHQSEKFVLAGSLGLGTRSATFISLVDWVDGVIEGTDVPLVRPRTSLSGSGGLHAGWGISRRFGLLGSLVGIFGESFDGKGNNDWKTDARLAVSYDLVHDIKVPLGLAITGGFYDDDLGGDKHDVLFWSARLAYQGRRDFTIGLDLQTSYFDKIPDQPKLQISQFAIDMRYYF